MGQNCAFMHNCYNNSAYMHGYCSICISYFSIFFSLSPSLLLSIPSDSHLFRFLSSHSSSFHNCRSAPISRWSTSHHTPLDQIAADHSPLTLRFSHLIKIKPLPSINSLVNIKPLLHESWSNCHQSTHWFLVVWSVDFGLGGFLILDWFDLEWFVDRVLMMMVVVMRWRRRGRKKILKKKKKKRRRRRRRQRGGDRDKDCVKKKGVYSEEKWGLGGK